MTQTNNNRSKGSQYSRKSKSKTTAKKFIQGEPVFLYPCVCHNQPAKKEPCVPDYGVKLEDRKATLGSFRCSVTNKPTKVGRVKNTPKDSPIEAAA